MLYDINSQDFAHHVRHANSWNDLGIHCGLEVNDEGVIKNSGNMYSLKQKVFNMRLSTEHFFKQSRIPDDDFKIIVKESDRLTQVIKKCNTHGGSSRDAILHRIENLKIDVSHFKKNKSRTQILLSSKLEAIDDDTFRTLLKNSKMWKDFAISCGFKWCNVRVKSILLERIKMLGLLNATNHFERIRMRKDTDKVFVVNSQYRSIPDIKKRLVTDLGWRYEYNECKNVHFVEQDGALTWMNKPVLLQLDHINGIHDDNRLENLRFLCALCHSQTSTWCGKNSKRHKSLQTWLDDVKTSHAPGSIPSLLN
jgi:hypothetical protein